MMMIYNVLLQAFIINNIIIIIIIPMKLSMIQVLQLCSHHRPLLLLWLCLINSRLEMTRVLLPKGENIMTLAFLEGMIFMTRIEHYVKCKLTFLHIRSDMFLIL
ncbi:hypothetical protein GLYMA_19G104201v4 [Glycine max]|nr:hypothetical protein GLYMA_19G104201v4 [Glycine max]KAG4396066.1 hypothetical protein GLYMA_19G104201v4 [Glycine max]KAH1077207.1 hypothetical protein GYH30_052637 [Glycine max]KAH1077208.1 hypothetical protein GYH30_052637 [Glycine max]